MLVANGMFGTLEFAAIGSVLPAPRDLGTQGTPNQPTSPSLEGPTAWASPTHQPSLGLEVTEPNPTCWTGLKRI